ncbi:hypothetical protein HALA3H3_p50011 [Halomonas sp. A3H3]|nr:hypothetical protein HALA3H3_p50011 [Halomonas sp. A3H3]
MVVESRHGPRQRINAHPVAPFVVAIARGHAAPSDTILYGAAGEALQAPCLAGASTTNRRGGQA